jgi:hypothetical protein
MSSSELAQTFAKKPIMELANLVVFYGNTAQSLGKKIRQFHTLQASGCIAPHQENHYISKYNETVKLLDSAISALTMATQEL